MSIPNHLSMSLLIISYFITVNLVDIILRRLNVSASPEDNLEGICTDIFDRVSALTTTNCVEYEMYPQMKFYIVTLFYLNRADLASDQILCPQQVFLCLLILAYQVCPSSLPQN